MIKNELKVGDVYFSVFFHDENLLIPDISTVIYLGENLIDDSGGEDIFFFQGAEKYVELGIWQPKFDLNKYDVVVMEEDILESVFDYLGLQQQLEYIKKGGARFYP
jgi:hypothetical protein